jgi:hypothetical protein
MTKIDLEALMDPFSKMSRKKLLAFRGMMHSNFYRNRGQNSLEKLLQKSQTFYKSEFSQGSQQQLYYEAYYAQQSESPPNAAASNFIPYGYPGESLTN